MARPKAADKDAARLKRWKERVDKANELYNAWDADFPGDLFESLYTSLGQWPGEEKRFEHLFFNGTASNIESIKPSYGLQSVRANLTPNPAKSDDDMGMLEQLMPDLEAMANTLIKDRTAGFAEEVALAAHDSFFRFGVIQVGYTADVKDNPNAGKPMVVEDTGKEIKDENGNPRLEAEKIPVSESIWFKRVPAKCLRFAPTTEWMVGRIPWVGYYEWVTIADAKKNPKYDAAILDTLKPGGSISGEEEETESEKLINEGKVCLWHIWDLVKSTYKVFAANSKEGFLLEEGYKHFPLHVLRFYPILDQPYPKPVVTDWVPMQMEANETREWLRTHRRRARRRYLYKESAFTKEAIEKIESGPDMAMIGIPGDPAAAQIAPIPDAPLDPASVRAVPATQSDWDQLSGVPAEARNLSSAGSATQANLMAGSSKGKGDYVVGIINTWLGGIIETTLKLAIEYFSLPLWVKILTDPASPMQPQNAQATEARWKQINMYDLISQMPGIKDHFSWSVVVEVERSRPETTDLERDRWNGLLQQLANPLVGRMLALSPVMLKHTMSLYNIESSRQVAEVQRALTMLVSPAPTPPGAPGAPTQGGPSGTPPRPGAPPVKQTPGGPQPGPPSIGGAGKTGPAPAGQSATSAQIGRS